ncbi:MAG: dihydroorotate dehydrogenase electron transfer subunit, partial [Gammaproteobacteria bacterium]
MSKPHRNTIVPEQAEITSHHAFAGDQFIMRMHAPEIARRAQPGSFVHIQCDPQLKMRRPISLMRAEKEAGW